MNSPLNSEDDVIQRLNKEIKSKNKEVKALNKKLEKSDRLLNKTQKYNEDLLQQIKTLCKSLESRRKIQRGIDANTQTEWNDVEVAAGESSWLAQSENKQMSIADCVRAAATEALEQTNFIFDEASGYYYDNGTGYYYDPVNSLYYHSESGTYYYLDQETQSYKFHSQVDLSQFQETATQEDQKQPKKKHKRKKHKSEKKKKRKERNKTKEESSLGKRSRSIAKSNESLSGDDDIVVIEDSDDERSEEGECSSSSEIESSDSDCNETEDNPNQNPPCIRCMVEKSEVGKVPEGTLFIITCSGATIGREKTNDVCLPDIQISKVHAEVHYDDSEKRYTIVDMGSQNGTVLNGSRLSESKQTSDLFILTHDDLLELPTVTLRLHIHIGLETCDHCEPGLVKANLESEKPKITVILSKDEKEKLRRLELKQIKRKFGLQAAAYENVVVADPNSGYSDRAEKRRKNKGSSNPYEKTEAASIDEAIRDNNKGFKMLKKMGWSEGTGLGKSESGITEPISLSSNTTRATLGATNNRRT